MPSSRSNLRVKHPPIPLHIINFTRLLSGATLRPRGVVNQALRCWPNLTKFISASLAHLLFTSYPCSCPVGPVTLHQRAVAWEYMRAIIAHARQGGKSPNISQSLGTSGLCAPAPAVFTPPAVFRLRYVHTCTLHHCSEKYKVQVQPMPVDPGGSLEH